MKNFNKIFGAIALLILVSCSDDFLDKRPSNKMSVEDLAYTASIKPAIAESNLKGIYNQMVTASIGGTGSQYDFGHKSFDLASDLLSSDLALTGSAYNRWVQLANLEWTVDESISIPNSTAWTFYYTIIKSANLVISSSGGNDVVPNSDGLKAVVGQAKALRAFAYFYLSQYYAVEFDAAKEILPIYTVPSEPAKAKSTMQAVYDFMIKDLKDSILLLSNYQRENKAAINANVAKGLLAYVYASMGQSDKNQLAKKLCDEVIQSNEFVLMNSTEVTGGFTSLGTPGWMWGFDVTKANDLGLVSWHGFMDYYSYSYQAVGNNKSIDKALYDRIPDADIRKKQFGRPTKSGEFFPGEQPLIPSGKFYNLDKKWMGQNPMEDDYVYMRVAEMYLLSAELSAVEGDEASAKSTLKSFLSKRYDSASDYSFIDDLSGDDLLEEIVFQTKIEFIAEGKSYLLMKRRKLENTRGSNHVNKSGSSFMYNDPRLSFMIPLKELQNNPKISSQNK